MTSTVPYDLAIQSGVMPNRASLSIIGQAHIQFTVSAKTEAELIGKLCRDYKLYPCPKKDGIFRTATECTRVRKSMAPLTR
jgi:hypothetical protein